MMSTSVMRRKMINSFIFSSKRLCSSNIQNDLVIMEAWSSECNAITKITMNNPKKRNCLSTDMMQSLTDKINEANECNDTHIIVINGNGPIFSAGHDLKELLNASQNNEREKLQNIFDTCTKLMLTVRLSQIPIISMVHGWASAAGLQLACASDLTVSTQNCQFSTPGVNIGLFCSTPAVELARCVGKKIAMEMLLTGEPINATRAYEVGLINHLIGSDDIDALHEKTFEIAQKIVSKSKPVIALGKRNFYEQIEMNLTSAL